MSVHLPAATRVPWSDLAGLRVGVVLWGGLALLDLARLTGAPSYAELGAVAVLVAVASIGASPGTRVGCALVGWLLVDGFVEHRYGVLGFGPADPAVIALLLGLALRARR